MALFLDLKVGESATVDHLTITLREKSGRRARLEIDSGKTIRINEHNKPPHPAAEGLSKQKFAV
jgi:hypothetical protein